MMRPGKIRGQQMKKLRCLKVGFPFLKAASMVTRGGKLAFSVRLMVTEMTAQEKEQREIFLEIKRREVKCREREAVTQECRQEQEDTGFYLQPYDHLTRDRRKAMDEIKAKIKAKYNLQY
ncbi:hypothetical protein Tco_1275892 [Tanacetum coccineum]